MLQTQTLKSFIRKMSNIGPKVSKDIERKMKALAYILQKEAYDFAPVDTGNLRDNITVEANDLMAVIKVDATKVPYAEVVHDYNPFLDDAADITEDEIVDELQNIYYESFYKNIKEAARG